MNDSWIRIAIASVLVLVVAGCGRPGEVETDTDAWTTVAMLRSDDAAWQGMEGMLVSEPFEAEGDVKVVMDMPEGGNMDGVITMIIPADQATDIRTLMGGIREGQPVMLVGAAPSQIVTGLDGAYVLVNSVSATHAWSVEIRTRSPSD